MRRGTLEDELGGVLQQQDRAHARRKTVARRREVAAQNVGLVHPRVGEKPVGRFGIRPILAGQRDAGAHAIAKVAGAVPRNDDRAGRRRRRPDRLRGASSVRRR